jgi:hypothetical protein
VLVAQDALRIVFQNDPLGRCTLTLLQADNGLAPRQSAADDFPYHDHADAGDYPRDAADHAEAEHDYEAENHDLCAADQHGAAIRNLVAPAATADNGGWPWHQRWKDVRMGRIAALPSFAEMVEPGRPAPSDLSIPGRQLVTRLR